MTGATEPRTTGAGGSRPPGIPGAPGAAGTPAGDAPRALPAHPAGRDPRLDGLRGLAILPVVLYHLTFFGYATSPVDRALTFLPSLGWTSVDLFFVLSGYLITGILWQAKGGERYFSSFYARRALRIFPLYYAVLVFFFVLAPRLAALGHAEAFWMADADRATWWHWLYLQNLHAAWTGSFHHHFLSIGWTLAIEEQFYLVWPWVVAFSSRRTLIRICLAMVVGAFLLRVAGVWIGASPVALLTFTPFRVDTLAAGALVSMLALDPATGARLARWGRRALPLAALLWLAVVLWARHETALAGPAPAGLTPDQRAAQALAFSRSPWIQTVGYSLDLAFYTSLLVWTLSAPAGSRLARWLGSGAMRGFGRYSYAIYLLHLFVAEFARVLFDPSRAALPFPVEQVVWWAVALALVYGVAWVSWHAFEAPILRLKRFVPMSSSGRMRRGAGVRPSGANGPP